MAAITIALARTHRRQWRQWSTSQHRRRRRRTSENLQMTTTRTTTERGDTLNILPFWPFIINLCLKTKPKNSHQRKCAASSSGRRIQALKMSRKRKKYKQLSRVSLSEWRSGKCLDSAACTQLLKHIHYFPNLGGGAHTGISHRLDHPMRTMHRLSVRCSKQYPFITPKSSGGARVSNARWKKWKQNSTLAF